MALIDTTSTIDSTMFLKNKFPHNKAGSNYYIQGIQEKRNRDWQFRPNLVDIEEELEKQCDYTKEPPKFTPIDVAIRKVKNEKGQDIGSDWADIAFRDLKHPNILGMRFRFDEDSFPDMSIMTEEEKYYNTSVWICVNHNPVDSSNNCIIRRCNSSFVFGGSPTNSTEDITEIHTEPVILENDLKYINIYYNMTTLLPQSEWYAIMQMNYFSNCIEINDRVIFGGVDLANRPNNAIFKVKAVVKSSSLKTFAKVDSMEIENIPLVIIALDKDTISENDDLHSRLANQPPIYITKPIVPTYQYYIQLDSIRLEPRNEGINGEAIYNGYELFGDYEERILQGQTEYYRCNLMFNEKIAPVQLEVKGDIPGKGNLEEYFNIELLDNNTFSITNLKRYPNSPIIVTCSFINPDNKEERISQDFEFILGGFY